jgi:very-short-patch-repair endonuclease
MHKHTINNAEYLEKYPGSLIYSKAYGDKLRQTNANRDPSYKKKLSENTKRLCQNKDWVKKHNDAMKIAQNTPEAKLRHQNGANNYFANRSQEEVQAHKNRATASWLNKEIRLNREKALKEAHNRPEVIKNHSKATKEFLDDPNNLKERKIALKKAWAEPEKRAKLNEIIKIGLKAAMSPSGRENFLKAQRTPEIRKKKSISAKKNMRKMLLSRKVYSGLNAYLEDQLITAGYKEKTDYEREYPIGPYATDFCFPKHKLVIEADGDWWHANPEFMKEKNRSVLHPIQKKMVGLDKAKNSYLVNHGWKVIRFWEREIYKKTEICIAKIKEAIHA